MKTLFRVILLFIALSCSSAIAEIFEGPGPDPACGGSSLKIEKTSKIVFMEHSIFTSSKTIVEQYKLTPNGSWEIAIFVYSIRWTEDKPLTNDKIAASYHFQNTDSETASEVSEKIGYGDINWRNEPKRLIRYFTENNTEFKKLKNG